MKAKKEEVSIYVPLDETTNRQVRIGAAIKNMTKAEYIVYCVQQQIARMDKPLRDLMEL
jgi:hypothetical protein